MQTQIWARRAGWQGARRPGRPTKDTGGVMKRDRCAKCQETCHLAHTLLMSANAVPSVRKPVECGAEDIA